MHKQCVTAMDYIESALSVVHQRLSKNPHFSLYIMCINQLMFIRSVLAGKEKDKRSLHSLNLGTLASKEFSTTDE